MVSGSSNSRFTLTRLSAFVSMALRFPKATYSLIGLELLVGVEGVDDGGGEEAGKEDVPVRKGDEEKGVGIYAAEEGLGLKAGPKGFFP